MDHVVAAKEHPLRILTGNLETELHKPVDAAAQFMTRSV